MFLSPTSKEVSILIFTALVQFLLLHLHSVQTMHLNVQLLPQNQKSLHWKGPSKAIQFQPSAMGKDIFN